MGTTAHTRGTAAIVTMAIISSMDLSRSIVTRNSASVTVIRCGTGMGTDTVRMLSELLRRAQQRRCVRQRLRRERVRRVVRERVVNVWRPSPSPLMKKCLQLLRKKHFGSGGAQAARIQLELRVN